LFLLLAAMTLRPFPALCAPLSEVDFAVVDTETTGTDHKAGRIIEIGVVKFRGGKIVAQQAWLINPGMDIPEDATVVHGISNEMVKDAPSFSEVFPDFVRSIAGSVLIAHSALFDIDFLRAEAKRNDLDLPGNPVLDTLKLARNRFPDAPGHSLQVLATYLNLGRPAGRPHRALTDARLTASLFMTALSQSPRIRTMDELVELCGGTRTLGPQPEPQRPRSDPATKSQNSSAGPESNDARICSTACVTLSPER